MALHWHIPAMHKFPSLSPEDGYKRLSRWMFLLKLFGAYGKSQSIYWPAEKNMKSIIAWVRIKYLDIINSVCCYLHFDLKMGHNHVTNSTTVLHHLIFQTNFFENLSQLVFVLDWICWQIKLSYKISQPTEMLTIPYYFYGTPTNISSGCI